MKFIVFAMMLFITTSTAYAVAENSKAYGSCGVATQSDDFSDKKSYQLVCDGKGESLGTYVAVLACAHNGRKFVSLIAGIQFHIEKQNSVMYRFDKGSVGKGDWIWASKSSMAIGVDATTYDEFIAGISTSKRLVYKVGENKGVVTLSGGDKAVKDYLKRCATIPSG